MRKLLLTLRSALLLLLLVGTVQIALGNFDRYDSFYHAGIYYRIVEDGIVSVVKPLYYNNYQGDIVIPSRVTASVSNYGEDYSLSYVVTGIDPEAFKNCIGLTSIELPNTVIMPSMVVQAYHLLPYPMALNQSDNQLLATAHH